MKKIVVVQPIHPRGMAILQEGAQVIVPPNSSDEAVIEAGHDADALVVRLSRVSAALLQGLPSLKVIGRNGVGMDNIDVVAASARGIALINTPSANSNSVAEYVIAAFMTLHKKLLQLDGYVRQGDWQRRDQIRGIDLQSTTIGIVGMGDIGSIVAHKCIHGLGMQVLAYDPFVSKEHILKCNATPVDDLDFLLKNSDVVSLHIPLSPQTQNLLNMPRLKMMKQGSVLVNASRGGIIDESALVEVLKAGHLGGAALDVFANEPPQVPNPLWDAPNLLVTPHIAGMTEDAAARISETMAKDVVAVLEGLAPVNLFNRARLS